MTDTKHPASREVPREPTPEMIAAVELPRYAMNDAEIAYVWRAMFDASPAPVESGDDLLVEQGYADPYDAFRNKWIGDHEGMIADLVRDFVPRSALTKPIESGDRIAALEKALTRVAGHVTTMQRVTCGNAFGDLEAVAKDCIPEFESVGMSNEGDGWGFCDESPAFTKDWCINMARQEDGAEIGAGSLAADPIESAAGTKCPYCDNTGDVHRADGEWLGECTCRLRQMTALDEELGLYDDESVPPAESSERLIGELVEALRPFVAAFEAWREVYAKRYDNNDLGRQTFDAMPDDWPMDKIAMSMGEFRKACAALSVRPQGQGEVSKEAALASGEKLNQWISSAIDEARPIPAEMPDVAGLVERLRAKKCIGFSCANYELINPDGPEAATALERMVGVGSFQSRVQPWMLECFGAEIAGDMTERCDRFVEEVFELVQALGYDEDRILSLRNYTYCRPVGDPPQEVGGVMVTLAALCLAAGLDMHPAGETELARINEPETIAKIRAKQAAKPTGSALPIAPKGTPDDGK